MGVCGRGGGRVSAFPVFLFISYQSIRLQAGSASTHTRCIANDGLASQSKRLRSGTQTPPPFPPAECTAVHVRYIIRCATSVSGLVQSDCVPGARPSFLMYRQRDRDSIATEELVIWAEQIFHCCRYTPHPPTPHHIHEPGMHS